MSRAQRLTRLQRKSAGRVTLDLRPSAYCGRRAPGAEPAKMTCSRATSPAAAVRGGARRWPANRAAHGCRSSRPSFFLTSTPAGAPSGLLRSEPSTARFKGKSQAIVARRLAMARPRPAQGLRPRLSATRPCSP